jgi:hypothetical protein
MTPDIGQTISMPITKRSHVPAPSINVFIAKGHALQLAS